MIKSVEPPWVGRTPPAPEWNSVRWINNIKVFLGTMTKHQRLIKKLSTHQIRKLEKLSLKKKIPLIKVVYLSIILAFLNLLMPIVVQSKLPPEVPLFYGLAQGAEQLTGSLGPAIPGVISLIIITTNLTLALLIKNKFLQHILVLASFTVSMFSVITSIKIILLIGSF